MSNNNNNRNKSYKRDPSIQFRVFKLHISCVYYRRLDNALKIFINTYAPKDNSKELRCILGKLEINIDFGFYSRWFFKKISDPKKQSKSNS